MVSTYHGIETGRRAIELARKSMEIAGINTNNSVSDGYSRQVVKSVASSALFSNTSASALGSGVDITAIQRMRDQFLDARLRRASVDAAYWQTMTNGADRVEKFMINVNAKGMNNMLDSFWESLQTLQVNPSEDLAAVRSALLQESENLVTFVQSLYSDYSSYRNEINSDIKDMVSEANTLIDRIAILNDGISKVRLAGGEPNELLDARDNLVDRLTELTGANVGTSGIDDQDGDFRVDINGKMIIQGTNVRHLVLVENATNNGFYNVQIEYNQYDITSDPAVAGVVIEQRADDLRDSAQSCTMDGTHNLDVIRTADELYWTVGYGEGQLTGGSRLDQISDASAALGIDGSFALQVGSSGVRVVSEAYTADPPGKGFILGAPGPGEATEYSFRVAAGSFETTINITWDAAASAWQMSDNAGSAPAMASGPGGALSVSDLGDFMAVNYSDDGLSIAVSGNALTIESRDRQMLSITDMKGSLMRSSGLANDNPIVKIDVTEEDSLWTIANKINNAYRFDRVEGDTLSYDTDPADGAPQMADQWMHASVEWDGSSWYLSLTSNVAGESARINVMPGSVCGDDANSLHVAALLGLVENSATQSGITSYIQYDKQDASIITAEKGDVYVDDAYVKWDGKEYLSSANDFKSARAVSTVGAASASALSEMAPGIRFSLNDTGNTTITVRHPLTSGAIFASVKLRDDVLLGQMDVFDDLVYELATQFNALHYSGYGTGEYEQTTGMSYFQQIGKKYGAFSQLTLDSELFSNPTRVACAIGDGSGKSLGCGSGVNMLSLAQLKQDKLFLGGTADFNGLYTNFIANLGSFGANAASRLDNDKYVIEQVDQQRQSIMGVNADEEMLSIVTMNNNFNMAGQYISTLLDVIDQIINGLGRVGL